MKDIIEFLKNFTSKSELEKETLKKINLLVRGNKNIPNDIPIDIPIDIYQLIYTLI
jgi:hypothetical protein